MFNFLFLYVEVRQKKRVHGVNGKLHIIDTKFSVYVKILENICNPIIGFLKY